MSPWEILTVLGDANVTLPAAVLVALWLVSSGAKSLALLWCGLFSALLALVAATKLAFLGWGIGLAGLDFTGISGHSSRSAAVVPVFVFMLAWNAEGAGRRSLVALSYALAALISASRVMIEAHSIAEAVIGFLLGCMVSAVFLHRAGRHQAAAPSRPLVWASLVILGGFALLGPAPTKMWAREAALYLSERTEPFRRGDLRPAHESQPEQRE